MRRTQLYLEDELWKRLHVLARQSRTTISELVRSAIREKYVGDAAGRREALLSAVGLWKHRSDLEDVDGYIRGLRKGSRLERLSK
jgi:predicted DNA-binding ribbon-helix-helix protein